MNAPAVLLFKGRGIISKLIGWQTRSPYSHAAFLLPSGKIVESWQGDGVRIKTLDDWRDVDAFAVVGITDDQWATATAFALGQVGSSYDYRAIARFLSRTRAPMDDRWFCSELVFGSLQRAGVHLLERIDAAAVDPGKLAISPLLVPVPDPLREVPQG